MFYINLCNGSEIIQKNIATETDNRCKPTLSSAKPGQHADRPWSINGRSGQTLSILSTPIRLSSMQICRSVAWEYLVIMVIMGNW